MSDYHRAHLPRGTFFFTVVCNKRQPIFKEESAIDILFQCFQAIQVEYPFSIDAFVILPDHLHTIWTLPVDDADFSTRWKRIKASYSRHYHGSIMEDISVLMRRKGEKGIWQRRFWEHTIRDQIDFNRHCDYIHYNPVKHGFVKRPLEWKHSSFTDLVEKGIYSEDWGQSVEKEVIGMDLE